jgi:hypothetical protein
MKIKTNAVDPDHFQDLKDAVDFFLFFIFVFFERISIVRTNSVIEKPYFTTCLKRLKMMFATTILMSKLIANNIFSCLGQVPKLGFFYK